jgi:hypothetical protein
LHLGSLATGRVAVLELAHDAKQDRLPGGVDGDSLDRVVVGRLADRDRDVVPVRPRQRVENGVGQTRVAG